MLLCESLYDPFAGVEVAVLVAAVAGDGGRLVGGQATQVVDGGVDRGERGMGGAAGRSAGGGGSGRRRSAHGGQREELQGVAR